MEKPMDGIKSRHIYHVASGWTEGGPILSLLAQIERGLITYQQAEAHVAARWPEVDVGAYLTGPEASEVHCHHTLQEARAYLLEFGGDAILVIDATALTTRPGVEYDHPTVQGEIPARAIVRVISS